MINDSIITAILDNMKLAANATVQKARDFGFTGDINDPNAVCAFLGDRAWDADEYALLWAYSQTLCDGWGIIGVYGTTTEAKEARRLADFAYAQD